MFSMIGNRKRKWRGLTAMLVMMLALLILPGSGQAQVNCPLVLSSVTGDLSNFTVENLDSTTLSISIPAATVGVWGTLVVGSSTNANVVVGAVPLGTKTAVTVTASKIDPALAASFVLVATDSVGHTVTINAIADCPVVTTGCTYTQGFWKNKPGQWPVQSLTLGTVNYTKAQLITIFRTPVRGNGLVSLSHQLIAAKLNQAAGTTVPAGVASAIAAADSLIGNLVVPSIGNGYLSPDATSSLNNTLDAYNNGLAPGGPPHCD